MMAAELHRIASVYPDRGLCMLSGGMGFSNRNSQDLGDPDFVESPDKFLLAYFRRCITLIIVEIWGILGERSKHSRYREHYGTSSRDDVIAVIHVAFPTKHHPTMR